MTDPLANQLANPRRRDPRQRTVAALRLVGVLASLVGVVCGIVIAVNRAVVTCTDGESGPPCHDYPDVTAGIAVVALSLAAGVIVLLLSMLMTASERRSAVG